MAQGWELLRAGLRGEEEPERDSPSGLWPLLAASSCRLGSQQQVSLECHLPRNPSSPRGASRGHLDRNPMRQWPPAPRATPGLAQGYRPFICFCMNSLGAAATGLTPAKVEAMSTGQGHCKLPGCGRCSGTNGRACLQIVRGNLSCKHWHQASPARPPGLEGDL